MENCLDCGITPRTTRFGDLSVESWRQVHCTHYKYTGRSRNKTLQLGLLNTNRTVFHEHCYRVSVSVAGGRGCGKQGTHPAGSRHFHPEWWHRGDILDSENLCSLREELGCSLGKTVKAWKHFRVAELPAADRTVDWNARDLHLQYQVAELCKQRLYMSE